MESQVKDFKDEDWMTQDEWYQTKGVKLFANRSRWDWFFRKYRTEIVTAGCIGILGRSLVVRPSWLEQVIDDLVVREANARLSSHI
tara:strand:+ start:203 stop:460 length:258 start_codon:yes stop_codon:yes gene_type:complete